MARHLLMGALGILHLVAQAGWLKNYHVARSGRVPRALRVRHQLLNTQSSLLQAIGRKDSETKSI